MQSPGRPECSTGPDFRQRLRRITRAIAAWQSHKALPIAVGSVFANYPAPQLQLWIKVYSRLAFLSVKLIVSRLFSLYSLKSSRRSLCCFVLGHRRSPCFPDGQSPGLLYGRPCSRSPRRGPRIRNSVSFARARRLFSHLRRKLAIDHE